MVPGQCQKHRHCGTNCQCRGVHLERERENRPGHHHQHQGKPCIPCREFFEYFTDHWNLLSRGVVIPEIATVLDPTRDANGLAHAIQAANPCPPDLCRLISGHAKHRHRTVRRGQPIGLGRIGLLGPGQG